MIKNTARGSFFDTPNSGFKTGYAVFLFFIILSLAAFVFRENAFFASPTVSSDAVFTEICLPNQNVDDSWDAAAFRQDHNRCQDALRSDSSSSLHYIFKSERHRLSSFQKMKLSILFALLSASLMQLAKAHYAPVFSRQTLCFQQVLRSSLPVRAGPLTV